MCVRVLLACFGALLFTSCTRSYEIVVLPGGDASVDGGVDAPFDVVVPDNEAAVLPMCPPAPNAMLDCSASPTTDWTVTTPNSQLTGTLPIASSVAGTLYLCDRGVAITWDASVFGRADIATVELSINAPEIDTALVGPLDVASPSDAGPTWCVLSLKAEDGSTTAELPCHFDGCIGFTEVATHVTGRLTASGSGFDVDMALSVPACSVQICL